MDRYKNTNRAIATQNVMALAQIDQPALVDVDKNRLTSGTNDCQASGESRQGSS